MPSIASITNLHDATWCPESTLFLTSASSKTGIDVYGSPTGHQTTPQVTVAFSLAPQPHKNPHNLPTALRTQGRSSCNHHPGWWEWFLEDDTSTDDSTQSCSSGSHGFQPHLTLGHNAPKGWLHERTSASRSTAFTPSTAGGTSTYLS